MVTSAPKIESPEDVIKFIPDNDFGFYDNLDKEEIRDGHACQCDHNKFGRSQDTTFYTGDKTAINTCSDCGGYYGVLLNNW